MAREDEKAPSGHDPPKAIRQCIAVFVALAELAAAMLADFRLVLNELGAGWALS